MISFFRIRNNIYFIPLIRQYLISYYGTHANEAIINNLSFFWNRRWVLNRIIQIDLSFFPIGWFKGFKLCHFQLIHFVKSLRHSNCWTGGATIANLNKLKMRNGFLLTRLCLMFKLRHVNFCIRQTNISSLLLCASWPDMTFWRKILVGKSSALKYAWLVLSTVPNQI